jgi:hypothetical protein
LAQFWGLEKKENQWSRSYSFEFKQKAKKQQAYKQSILEPKAKHPKGVESKDWERTKEAGNLNLLKRIRILDARIDALTHDISRNITIRQELREQSNILWERYKRATAFPTTDV